MGGGPCRWREGPERFFPGDPDPATNRLSGLLRPLPLLQTGNTEWDLLRARKRLWRGGPVPSAARGAPLPQFPHLTPRNRSSHLLDRLSRAPGTERVKSHLPPHPPLSLEDTVSVSPRSSGIVCSSWPLGGPQKQGPRWPGLHPAYLGLHTLFPQGSPRGVPQSGPNTKGKKGRS